MLCGRQTERLRLSVFVGVEASVDFPVADNQHRKHEPEERSADSDHARQTDSLKHDIAKAGDFVLLDDFHDDRRFRGLHRSIVQQGQRRPDGWEDENWNLKTKT